MAGFFSMKMKRKELEEVNEDFSDFSLSSPARKIRRLDAELPPIMEDEEVKIPTGFKQSFPVSAVGDDSGGPVIEELPCHPVNEERAIVLFKPMTTPLMHSPTSFTVSSDIISGFKNQLWSSQSSHIKSATDEEGETHDKPTNECLAVVPWVPSQVGGTPGMVISEAEIPDMMEADDMEIEENYENTQRGEVNVMRESGGLHQWHQQHCMTSHLPQNTSTPIAWFR